MDGGCYHDAVFPFIFTPGGLTINTKEPQYCFSSFFSPFSPSLYLRQYRFAFLPYDIPSARKVEPFSFPLVTLLSLTRYDAGIRNVEAFFEKGCYHTVALLKSELNVIAILFEML